MGLTLSGGRGAEPPANGLHRAARAALLVLAGEIAVLAGTGLLLIFFYRPSASQSWGLAPGGLHDTITFGRVVHTVHHVVAQLALPTALASAVLTFCARRLVSRRSHRRSWIDLFHPLSLVILVLFVSFTGYLLPWDQLALWAVTVGTNMMGILPLFGHQVQFVLIGGSRVSKQTVLWWLFIHAVIGGPLLLAALVSAGRSVSADRPMVPASAAVEHASTVH